MKVWLLMSENISTTQRPVTKHRFKKVENALCRGWMENKKGPVNGFAGIVCFTIGYIGN